MTAAKKANPAKKARAKREKKPAVEIKQEPVKPVKKRRKSRKKTTPEKKLGRPPVPYNPDRYPEWVRGLASRGATRPEICKAMGISHGTLNAWKERYPDFLAAIQVGKNETIARLRNSLMKKAIGFSIPVTKTEEYPSKVEGESATISKITRTEEYFPPDVRAATILLVNLDPKFKTDRTQSEHTGADGAPLESTIIIIPDNGRDKIPA
ncbi:MAG: helix-turn-helix domain-containing protein [Methanoregula sp.]|nr:helix-turn-helix domain-containing protein [Methanoregula sp.]